MLSFLLIVLAQIVLSRLFPGIQQISDEGLNQGLRDDDVQSCVAYGEPVDIRDHPYFAGLSRCGAAIIAEQWVLTAGHCVETPEFAGRYAYVGGETYENSQRVRISEIFLHDNYSLPLNDIALVKLAKPLKFTDKIQPVKLPKKNTKINEGSTHVFVGKGRDETDRPSGRLMKMNVETYSVESCFLELLPALLFYSLKELNKSLICSHRVEDFPGAGRGDSGSPMVRGNTLVGIASFITNEDGSNDRTLFLSKVSYFVPWIKATIERNEARPYYLKLTPEETRDDSNFEHDSELHQDSDSYQNSDYDQDSDYHPDYDSHLDSDYLQHSNEHTSD